MMQSSSKASFTIACVVDQHPRFYTELVLWAVCANRYLPKSYKKVVYFVEDIVPDLAAWLGDFDFETKISERIVPGSPHCNKIATFFDDHDTDYVIVTDSDLFFVADPSALFGSDRVRAAPNNHCNPPPEIFKGLLAAAEPMIRPYRPGASLFAGPMGSRETHINNISAGIIAVPGMLQSKLANTWRNEALWLAERMHLLGPWAVHIDQVAFCLAMERLEIDVEFLPPQLNCILHMLPFVSTVLAFHISSGHTPYFADKFRNDRTLAVAEFPDAVSEPITRLNSCIIHAMEIITQLPSTRDHTETFLNPKWSRSI